jgi:hypothetical protein
MTYSEAWLITGIFAVFGIVALCAYFFFPDNHKNALFVLLTGIICAVASAGFFIATLALI